MKNIVAGLILATIAAALFILLMGNSEETTHVSFFQVAVPFLVIYGVFAHGLKKYRRRHHVTAMLSFTLACLGSAFVVCVKIFDIPLSPAVGGRVLFAAAFIDLVIGFFLPLREAETKGRPSS